MEGAGVETQETSRFADIAIVSCGVMKPELSRLAESGWLDAGKILYTPPGLHQFPEELEKHLVRQVRRAQESFSKVIVVFGGKFCYVNAEEPTKTIETIIEELGPGVVRIQATHCMDMVASEQERETMAAGQNVLWMTPGWVKYQKEVYKGWDAGHANEHFPRHDDGAFVIDALGFMDDYMEKNPETFLEYCDWMGIPMYPAPTTLDRLQELLLRAKVQLDA